MTNTDIDTHVVQNLDPIALLEIQAVFGELVTESPRLTQFINQLGPVLFGMLLFTMCQDYVITDDGESVTPTKSNIEAGDEAIGMVKSIVAAMNKLDGEVAVSPSDQEIDADTDIEPVDSSLNLRSV